MIKDRYVFEATIIGVKCYLGLKFERDSMVLTGYHLKPPHTRMWGPVTVPIIESADSLISERIVYVTGIKSAAQLADLSDPLDGLETIELRVLE